MSPAAELPKIPLRIISNSEVPEDSREKSSSLGDDLILDTDSDSDDVNERPLFDEFGTIITYPDKQLTHTDISEQQKEIRRFEQKSQVSISIQQ
ncbi:unnamed protein product [Anisakis simplex]|uniref:Uncharacterized protein n=1 Tax=Anisakis simplex TaxID=6269 RepID=A0A3P6Q2H3_ANISI|nr:unnamed protein product [Anisakis simplex]